jgi:hypothetical protein
MSKKNQEAGILFTVPHDLGEDISIPLTQTLHKRIWSPFIKYSRRSSQKMVILNHSLIEHIDRS